VFAREMGSKFQPCWRSAVVADRNVARRPPSLTHYIFRKLFITPHFRTVDFLSNLIFLRSPFRLTEMSDQAVIYWRKDNEVDVLLIRRAFAKAALLNPLTSFPMAKKPSSISRVKAHTPSALNTLA